MRIGIDMLGLQSPESRGRGIGRYSRSLIASMLAVDPANDYLFYAHDGLSTDDFPEAPNASVRYLLSDEDRGRSIDRLVRANPDDVDAFLISSPFEIGNHYDPPPRPVDGPVLTAVLYDLVPFLFQERYLTWPPAAARLYRSLERLRRYDALLSISDATRIDLDRMLGLPPGRAVNISGASDPTFFVPAEPSAESAEALRALGIDGSFVFCLASFDWRKNLVGLLDAFRLLPAELRSSHQLVISCHFSPDDAANVRKMASERGIDGSLLLTGRISDETLRLLYQRCAVYAFPAIYEGFGLPLLEAMHCGAPVVAGNNSSQIEVVGDAGLLANVRDAGDVAAKLARVLTDGELADRMRVLGIEHAKRFRWETTGRLAVDAIVGAVGRREVKPSRRPKQRIAVFSPWPPKASGISDYAVRLVGELTKTYAVDVYHDSGYQPDLGPLQREVGVYHHRVFGRVAGVKGYRGVVYQMGNSYYHHFVYEAMARYPGVVALHDFALSGFHLGYERTTQAGKSHFADELRRCHPDRAADALDLLAEWSLEDGGVADGLPRRGLWMNRGVFERAGHVVVHSPWCLERLAELYPEYLDKTSVVPMGATPRPLTDRKRAAIRARFGLPADALIFGAFGIVHANKGSVETVGAFAEVARRHPSAWLVFAGQDLTGGAPLDAAESLGIADRVRLLGRQSADDFAALIAAVDVGLALRRPPTGGETSAALLDLLRHGISTVVTDVGTFADYPDDVVRKVPWESGPTPALSRALLDLASDRRGLAEAALRYVDREHSWARAAARYAEEIERVYARFGNVTATPEMLKKAV